MPKREEVSTPISCKCGATGRAVWEEDENPVFGGGASELIELTIGFSKASSRNAQGDQHIQCDACNLIINQ